MSETIFTDLIACRLEQMIGDEDKATEMAKEIHAISCSSKPLAGWTARDAIQECREACGGHGFSAGTLRKKAKFYFIIYFFCFLS